MNQAKIQSLMNYILTIHPPYHGKPNSLPNYRLTKILYLIDWRSAISGKDVITDINWKYDRFGPYSDVPIQIAQSSENLQITTEEGPRGGDSVRYISISDPQTDQTLLTSWDKAVANFIVNMTSSKSSKEFINLVYSTYPVVTQPKFSFLNIKGLADEYLEFLRQNGKKLFPIEES